MTYFDTTQLPAEALERARASARYQDEMVMQMFRHAKRPMSPSQVWAWGFQHGMEWPLTSARRSICTLTDDGLLEKTEAKRRGFYGKPEFFWQLPAEGGQHG